MARIVYAWELGGDFGHLASFLPLARELHRAGHTVDWVLHDLSNIETALPDPDCRIFQAPLWTTPVTGLPAPVNFAETLLNFGYHDRAGLAGMLRGWRALYDTLRPELLVCDHAPTALLAARGLEVRTIAFGAPFGVPPRIDPLPPYRWWAAEPRARLVDSCRHVLQVCNDALARIGGPPLAALADLFAADDTLLLGLPELDHYGARQTDYLGPLFGLAGGAAPRWPLAGKGRVFAYLKPGSRDFDAVLQALAACGASVVVFAPGVAARTVRTYSNATLSISDRPLDMEAVRRECDAGICHGGMGTTAALLLAGKPVLLVPMQMEQMMLGKRVEALGAGVTVVSGGAPDPRRAVKRLLSDATLAEAAREFARRYSSLQATAQVAQAAARCAALLEPRRP